MSGGRVSYRLPEVMAVTGLSRSTLYRAMASGALLARKVDRSIIITAEDLERFVGSRPRAHFGSRPDPCPTCEGAGCERCYMTGRRHLCKIDIAPTTDGRAVVQVWQGAPGTMQVVALTAPDRDLADVTVDAWLACLQNGGLIINDRRAR